jgi:hypothetical protein
MSKIDIGDIDFSILSKAMNGGRARETLIGKASIGGETHFHTIEYTGLISDEDYEKGQHMILEALRKKIPPPRINSTSTVEGLQINYLPVLESCSVRKEGQLRTRGSFGSPVSI